MPVITAFPCETAGELKIEVQVFDYMRVISYYPQGMAIAKRDFDPLTIPPLRFDHFDVAAGRLVLSKYDEHPAGVSAWYEAFCTWAEWNSYVHEAVKEGRMQ